MDTLSRHTSYSAPAAVGVFVLGALAIGLIAYLSFAHPFGKPTLVTVIVHTPTQSIEYKDVVIQQDRQTYVTFLTKDGQQIEHTGAFSVIRKEAGK